MADPDAGLVLRLQQGDDSALDEIMAHHQEPIHRFIFRYIGNDADAVNLTQETFVRAFFHIGKYRPQAKFVTWLYQIATNLCRDELRSKHHRQARFTHSLSPLPADGTPVDQDLADPSRGPDAQAVGRETLRALQTAIDTLPSDLKPPFILCLLEDRSQAETAELLGLSIKAVETRIYRARKILQRSLSGVTS